MKFAVMGAGAVGCYYGGMLARGGHEVVLIARPRHVQAIQQHGLLMETLSFKEHVQLQASSEAAASIAPHLEKDAVVLSLQNGVDNAERAQAVLKQTVIPAVVYVATEMAGPGHVKHHGRGELVIGPAVRSAALVAEFARAGVPVQISDNVMGALWSKLIINCAYNALSAITQLPYGRLVQGPGIEAVMHAAVDEALAVAQAGGVRVLGDAWGQVQAIARTMATQFSSTAQDLAGGKRSEIDYLNGHVVRQGERLGIPTPVNRTLQALVKTLEAKQSKKI
jgi:2-dehydropantoate 2-reductase